MTERAAVYCRVSSSPQDAPEKVSLKNQEADCRAFATAKGYSVVEVVTERHSGKVADRPGLDRVLELVRSGAVTAVVCWDPTRFMRSMEDALVMGRDIRRLGARVEFTHLGSTGNASTDRLLGAVGAWFGEEEAVERLRRTIPARKASMQNGRWPGKG